MHHQLEYHVKGILLSLDRFRSALSSAFDLIGHFQLTPRRLNDPKAQEKYYNKIVERYLAFCTESAGNREELLHRFASLEVQDAANNASSPWSAWSSATALPDASRAAPIAVPVPRQTSGGVMAALRGARGSSSGSGSGSGSTTPTVATTPLSIPYAATAAAPFAAASSPALLAAATTGGGASAGAVAGRAASPMLDNARSRPGGSGSAAAGAASSAPNIAATSTTGPSPAATGPPPPPPPPAPSAVQVAAAKTLTLLLMSLRKLRESLVAVARADDFTAQALLFNIRLGILARSPESYHAALTTLLRLDAAHQRVLLTSVERTEVVGYLALDTACRRGLVREAYEVLLRWRTPLRVVMRPRPIAPPGMFSDDEDEEEEAEKKKAEAKAKDGGKGKGKATADADDEAAAATDGASDKKSKSTASKAAPPPPAMPDPWRKPGKNVLWGPPGRVPGDDGKVEQALWALIHDNWVLFSRVHRSVDGYRARLMEYGRQNLLRRHVLKAFGRSYLTVPLPWLERNAGESWDELRRNEGLGWELVDVEESASESDSDTDEGASGSAAARTIRTKKMVIIRRITVRAPVRAIKAPEKEAAKESEKIPDKATETAQEKTSNAATSSSGAQAAGGGGLASSKWNTDSGFSAVPSTSGSGGATMAPSTGSAWRAPADGGANNENLASSQAGPGRGRGAGTWGPPIGAGRARGGGGTRGSHVGSSWRGGGGGGGGATSRGGRGVGAWRGARGGGGRGGRAGGASGEGTA